MSIGRSYHMKTTSAGIKNVTLCDGFWKDRQTVNKNVTLDAVYDRFKETGRIDAFELSWRPGDDKEKPHFFWDSDVAKWIEGAAYVMMRERIPAVEEKIDSIVDAIQRNMTCDGYFNVYYCLPDSEERFTERLNHELYCAGHHFEAACAYFEATGKDKYLRLMERFADLIYKVFVEEKSANFVTPGHPEIELALIKLYRTTGNTKYLRLCSFFVENRGANDKDIPHFDDPLYAYDHAPLRKAVYADGHSVRTNYLFSGVCDLSYETDDKELFEACKRVFDNAVHKRMYITGSQGATYIGERYTSDYHLPNKSAYAETCAAISLAMWARRMSLSETNSEYADIIERILYNGALSGVSLEGDSFFYENPLEYRNEDYLVNYGNFWFPHHTADRKRRKVFGCSCCPPNILRFIASVGDYIYSVSQDTVFVDQFISSEYCDGNVTVKLETDFPCNGRIKIVAEGMKKLAVRIPYYSKNPKISLPYTEKNGYAFFDIEGKTEILINLELCARFVYANTNVYDNAGRAAVMYGPIVYCAETVDNDTVHNFFVDTSEKPTVCGEIFGVPQISVSGITRTSGDELYSELPPTEKHGLLKLIPYFAFAERGECEMLTFISVK